MAELHNYRPNQMGKLQNRMKLGLPYYVVLCVFKTVKARSVKCFRIYS